MKQGKRLLLMLLAVLFLMTALLPITGLAEENRKYVVRFFGGNKGSINTGTYYEVLPSGSVKIPTSNDVTVDEDYYLKGFVESGKDPRKPESSDPTNPSYVVMSTLLRDIDYMAVYGIRGTEVQYTVQYLQYGTTRKLAADGIFYAGVGDRPISSYIYIEGYQPYLRSQKTLVADESQNVLFCYYTAIPAATTTTTTTGGGAAVAGGGAAVAAGAANAAGANAAKPAGGANAANPAGGANAANPANPAGGAANPAPAVPQYQQTEDILDLDVPLAAPDFGPTVGQQAVPNAPKVIEPTQRSPLPNWMLIAGVVVLVGLISMLYWYLLFYRKRKRFEQQYDFSVFDDTK